MRKRIGVAVVSLLLTLAAVLGFGATAAQASVYGCQDAGHMCVWNYQSYNYVNDGHGGIYDFDLRSGFGSCHVMPTSGATGWTNGKVYNAASSLLINNTGTNSLTTSTIYFFDSNACNTDTDYYFTITFQSGDLYGIPILANWKPDGPTGWNDRIGSFKVVHS